MTYKLNKRKTYQQQKKERHDYNSGEFSRIIKPQLIDAGYRLEPIQSGYQILSSTGARLADYFPGSKKIYFVYLKKWTICPFNKLLESIRMAYLKTKMK